MQTQPHVRLIKGWRNADSERVYDLAVEIEGYYFKEDLPPSRQKNYQREYYHKRMQKEADKIRERVRGQMKSETGRNNQDTVLKSIKRIKAGKPPHPQATILSAETFDKVRAKLVDLGKLPELTKGSVTGQIYVDWLKNNKAEYNKGQPRFGFKK